MIMVIDIGNTNIVFGVYKKSELLQFWRMRTVIDRTSDEFGLFIIEAFNNEGIAKKEIEAVVISSVVPSVMYSVEHAIKKYFNLEPMIIGPGIKTGINIKYENPKEVGADRIVNAVAAFTLYGAPLIVVDFGTATTFCALSSKNEYLGGVICPGIKISAEALFSATAKLPRIEFVKPSNIIGKNTVSSMQSGILYGYAGQVDHIVNRIKQEMVDEYNQKQPIKVIATGGLARLIASETKTIDEVNGLLTLEGLRIIYEKNV